MFVIDTPKIVVLVVFAYNDSSLCLPSTSSLPMVPHFLQNPDLFYCSTHFLLIFSYSIPSPNLHDTHIILYTLKPPVIQLCVSRLPQGLFKNFSFILCLTLLLCNQPLMSFSVHSTQVSECSYRLINF